MLVRLYKHKLKVNIEDDILKFKKYFSDNGINLVLSVEETSIPKQEATTKLILPQEGKFDVVFYIYNKSDFPEKYMGDTFFQTPKLVRIFIGVDKINDDVDFTWKIMSHEMMHALFFLKFGHGGNNPMDEMYVNGVLKPYYKNEDLYASDGNFAEAWKQLKKYKYFKESEIVGLKPELVQLLDQARGIADTPFVVTSGFRTPEQNKKVGGKPNSAHLKGMAVDILCTDNFKRAKILKGILTFRDQVFVEVAKKHIHIDICATIHELGQVMLELGDD